MNLDSSVPLNEVTPVNPGDPSAKTVLCFGDSNTWGQKPDKSNRYPSNVRWPGKLQLLLGDDYNVVEEGLGGRNTDMEHYNPAKLGRNGTSYLPACVESHNPIDLVILMLGTNDFKIQYDRSCEDIAQAIGGLISLVRPDAHTAAGEPSQVLLISPSLINAAAPTFREIYEGVYNDESAEKSRNLASQLRRVAEESGCHYLDAALITQPGEDGIHFDEKSHPALAEAIYRELKDFYL